MSVIIIGFLASAAAGAMTMVGAVPVLFGRSLTARQEDVLLAFAAGVMLAASFFSLLQPAVAHAEALYPSRFAPPAVVAVGLLLGAGIIAAANELIPHSHVVQGVQGPASAMSKMWLFVAAITIHNFPEGLVIGVGFGGGSIENGTALAMGMGLQNLPEGLAVAVALRSIGMTRGKAFLIAAATGLVEPLGGLLGVTVVSLSYPLLPWSLAFAAGSMLYIISHEIIPETHSRGHQREASGGMAIGFVIMMFLDIAFT